MLEKTSSKKRKRPNVDDAQAESDGVEVGRNLDFNLSEDEDEQEMEIGSGELTHLEHQINANEALHCIENLETRVHACPKCPIRLLSFCMAIHMHESHSVIVVDADGAEEGVTGAI